MQTRSAPFPTGRASGVHAGPGSRAKTLSLPDHRHEGAQVTQDQQEDPFVCPECGSGEAAWESLVSTRYDPQDPWSSILERITCAGCGFDIPAHLGRRQASLSIEDAKQEWKNVYRESAGEPSDQDEEDDEE